MFSWGMGAGRGWPQTSHARRFGFPLQKSSQGNHPLELPGRGCLVYLQEITSSVKVPSGKFQKFAKSSSGVRVPLGSSCVQMPHIPNPTYPTKKHGSAQCNGYINTGKPHPRDQGAQAPGAHGQSSGKAVQLVQEPKAGKRQELFFGGVAHSTLLRISARSKSGGAVGGFPSIKMGRTGTPGLLENQWLGKVRKERFSPPPAKWSCGTTPIPPPQGTD